MKYLVYREYATGLNNRLMSLELAVGLAHLTRRTLVYYGAESACYAPKEIQRLGDSPIPTLLDLLDPIPVPHIGFDEFDSLQARHDWHVRNDEHDLTRCVFTEQPEVDSDLTAFAEGRTVLRDVDQEVWRLDGSNLGFYSRFFHAPSRSLREVLRRVRPRTPYLEFASRVATGIGRFDGVHLRLTDFREAHPKFRLSTRRIRATLRATIRGDLPLIVCTDEPENLNLLRELLGEIPEWFLVEEFIFRDHREEFECLPFHDHVTLGLVCNLIMWNSRMFVGTAGSTYSGIIHREWLRRQLSLGLPPASLQFRFLESGLKWLGGVRGLFWVLLKRAPRRIFRDGVYLETREGPYSWNRTHMPLDTSARSWWCEWPEAVDVVPGHDSSEDVPLRPRLRSDLLVKRDGSDLAIYDPRADSTSVLNSTLGYVAKMCDGTKTAGEVVVAFADEHVLPGGCPTWEQAEEDARQSLEILQSANLFDADDSREVRS